MKRLWLFVLTISSLHSARAETTISVDSYNGYVWGSGERTIRGESQQLNVYTDFKNGVYLNMWGLTKQRKSIEEVDFTIGYLTELYGMEVDASISYYDVLPNFDGTEDDIVSPYITLTGSVTDSINVIAGAETYIVIGDSANSGIRPFVGIEKHWQAGNEISVTTALEVGYETNYQLDRWYKKVSIQPEWEMSDHVTLRFLGVTGWIPQNASMKYVVNFFGIDYTF